MTMHKNSSNPPQSCGYKPGDASYKFSTISMGDAIFMQVGEQGKSTTGLMAIDDIIVQVPPTPSAEETVAQPAVSVPVKTGTSDYRRGLLSSASGAALACGMVAAAGYSGLSAEFLAGGGAFALVVAPAIVGMGVSSIGSVFTKHAGLFAGGIGFSAALMGIGATLPGSIGVLSAVMGAVITGVHGLGAVDAMHEDVKSFGLSNGKKFAKGTCLGALAGAALAAFMSASVVDTALEPPHKPYPMNQRVEVHMDTTLLETAPRLTEDGAEYIPQKVVPRETVPRLN
ncbi:hypothetical protein [Micavibrio aeruginosavorus]|uniref:hypothetical protein n=1 Tax=Micavibrio aeruginosavorus TaxID=349221 RepID=UPI003F4AAE8C